VKIFVLATTAAALVSGASDSAFRYTRVLPSAVATGRVAFEPDNLLLAHARDDLGDVRVLDADGHTVPWRFVPDERVAVGLRAAVLNSGRRGDAAVALVDVGRPLRVYERVQLEISGGAFVGRVTAFGADRRQGPFTRLSTTTVYDVEGATSARSTTIVLPPTDYRFLELRASGVRRITGATVLGRLERPALVRRPHVVRGTRSAARATITTLDLGATGVPVTRLELEAVSPSRYDRPVSVDGTNDRRTFVPLAFGRITRAEGLRSTGLTMHSRFRYLRIRVENGDDAPLRGLRTETFGPSFAVIVEGGHGRELRLVYGANVAAPDYEFARLPVDQPVAVLDPSRLPPERPNPTFAVPGPTLGERYGWIVQASLGLAAVAVALGGFLALRRHV
jgi:hypothetical protein